jgi:protein gp37
MGDRSAIEWTDATWNPWRGCDKVSPGCAHCYMFRDQRRYGRDPSIVVQASPATFNAPLHWAAARMVFTCSWSDWFHETADPWRDQAWDIVRQTPQHTYQILTKRPERIADYLPADWGDGWRNVWLGVSIENRRFVHRADVLRAIPATIRFISAEPLLGPLVPDEGWFAEDGVEERGWSDGYTGAGLDLRGIDWLIVGGESGPKARPMRADWVRDLQQDCWGIDNERSAGTVAFFFKQWGGTRPGGEALLDGHEWHDFPAAHPPTPTRGDTTMNEELTQELHKPAPGARCRVCGCTDDQACEGGCFWVGTGLCSACIDNDPEES